MRRGVTTIGKPREREGGTSQKVAKQRNRNGGIPGVVYVDRQTGKKRQREG